MLGTVSSELTRLVGCQASHCKPERSTGLAHLRGPLRRSACAGFLVARRLLAVEEGPHPLPERRSGAIRCGAALAVRRGRGSHRLAAVELAAYAGIFLAPLLVLATQVADRRFAGRDASPHGAHSGAM